MIAVIAILAALLLPALAQARGKARRVFCAGSLRQLGLALNLYADEQERYPQCADFGAGASLWNVRLLPLVGQSLDVFYCPATPSKYRWTTEPSAAGFNFPTNIQGTRPFSYGMNAFGFVRIGRPDILVASLGLQPSRGPISGAPPSGMLPYGLRPSEIRVPADMIAIGDNGAVPYWPGVLAPRYQAISPEPAGMIGKVHNQGANMVFLDGHVEWARWWLWLGQAEAAARRWNFNDAPY